MKCGKLDFCGKILKCIRTGTLLVLPFFRYNHSLLQILLFLLTLYQFTSYTVLTFLTHSAVSTLKYWSQRSPESSTHYSGRTDITAILRRVSCRSGVSPCRRVCGVGGVPQCVCTPPPSRCVLQEWSATLPPSVWSWRGCRSVSVMPASREMATPSARLSPSRNVSHWPVDGV